MRAGLFIVILLGLSGDTLASTPPLVTAEYEVRAGSWDAHLAESERFAQDVKGASRKLNIVKERGAEGYYELGKVFERYVGHHDLTFLFYERAKRYLDRGEKVKNASKIRSDIEHRLQELASRKFEQMVRLADPTLDWPAGRIVVVPPDNVITAVALANRATDDGDFLPGEMYDWSSLFEENDTKLHIGRLGDIIARGSFGSYLDVALSGLCNFETRHAAEACWWVPRKRIRALVLSPPGYTLSVTYGPLDELGATLKSSVRNFFHVDRANEADVRVTKHWEFEETADRGDKELSLSQRIAELDNFLVRFPEYEDQARPVLDGFFFAGAVKRGTITAFEEYLFYYPDGRHAAEARDWIARTLLPRISTVQQAEEFLRQFPDGEHSEDARALLHELLFDRARKTASQADLEDLLSRDVETPLRAKIENELDRLRFLEARNQNTVASYREFIETWPQSPRIDSAHKAIAEVRAGQAFLTVRRTNTLEGYRQFLDTYPDSSWANEANAMAAYFVAANTRSLLDLERFLDLNRQVEVREVVSDEYQSALAFLKIAAESEASRRDQGAKAHLLIHRETGDTGYLRRAWNLRLIQTPETELYVLRNLPAEDLDKVFGVAEQGDELDFDADRTWFWATPVVSSTPAIEAVFVSAAKFSYRIEVELAVQVDYERYFYGITWLAPEGGTRTWSETYRASATVEVGPLPRRSERVTFQFPRFELYRESGPVVYSFRTEGRVLDPTHKIVAIDLIE